MIVCSFAVGPVNMLKGFALLAVGLISLAVVPLVIIWRWSYKERLAWW